MQRNSLNMAQQPSADDKAMVQPKRYALSKALRLLLLLLLSVLVFTAARFGLGNALFKPVEGQIRILQTISNDTASNNTASNDKAHDNNQTVHAQSALQAIYQQQLTAINRVLWLHRNPQYLEAKAQLLELGVRFGFNDKTQALTQANRLYIESITKRPAWPVTYSSLALNKWHLGEFDRDFVTYLVQAHYLGKNVPQVKQVWQYVANSINQASTSELAMLFTELFKEHSAIVAYYQQADNANATPTQQVK
ncbi:hypothetical protein QWY77_07650 [Thalassotalea ponticola]|uniref:hypothetical protein n=1 Tax=Thalassotalea ponticola TaxID=1523392 RepID=UPI0025B55963|nr:hypothetical protein [Thalassotalea ponticola]MDN3652635.1 hypothetical protein [Thalassotalea ponticola]